MDASELKALLQAAARELKTAVSDLPGDGDEASIRLNTELVDAREAIEEAAAACDSATTFGTGGLDVEPSEVLVQARSLRGDAVRARDVAESRLWALQDEHTELLERLHELSGQQQQRLEEQRAEADLATCREAALVERCEQLDNEVRSLRKDVDAKTQRLIASGALGHSLELSKRKLQRQHEGSMVENAVAREILALQTSTEAYVQNAREESGKVDESLEMAQKMCAFKMEGLQSEWSEQQAKYQGDMDSLQNRLLDLQKEYEERWRATEQSAREVISIKSQQASEARQNVETDILRLDEEWEKEAIASRNLALQQNQIMSDARQAALSEMEAKLEARQQDMEEQVFAERTRSEALRSRYLRKTADSQQEVLRYKQHINELSLGYRRKSHRSGPAPNPSRSMGGSYNGSGQVSLGHSGCLHS